MAILTVDFYGVCHLSVKVTVAVGVLGEVAVHAMHAYVHMDRGHMDCFLEFIWVLMRDELACIVDKIAASIFFEDGSKVPAMSVIVRELGVIHLIVPIPDRG